MTRINFNQFFLGAITFLVLCFMVAPIFVVLVASFGNEGYLAFPPQSYSLKWYGAFWNSIPFKSAFVNSLILATLSSLIGLIIGTISAYAIEKSAVRNILMAFFLSPLMVPGVIIGLAILRYAVYFNMATGIMTLLIGHVVIIIPYVVRTIMASLYRYNVSFEEAAQTLGANKVKTFFSITIPILKPGLVAAGSFAFIVSFTNLSVSIFLSSAKIATIPIRIFSYAEFSPDPTLAAISVITLLFTLAVMIIVEKTTGLDKVY